MSLSKTNRKMAFPKKEDLILLATLDFTSNIKQPELKSEWPLH